MHVFQSGLGEKLPHKPIRFDQIVFAKVAGVGDYAATRRVQVLLYNGTAFGGAPVPASMSELGIDVEPAEGDIVLLTYANGCKNVPVVLAYAKDNYAARGLLKLTKDGVIVNTYTADKTALYELLRIQGGVVTIMYAGNPLVTIQNGTVDINGTVALGAISDLEAKINNHESRIAALEAHFA